MDSHECCSNQKTSENETPDKLSTSINKPLDEENLTSEDVSVYALDGTDCKSTTTSSTSQCDLKVDDMKKSTGDGIGGESEEENSDVEESNLNELEVDEGMDLKKEDKAGGIDPYSYLQRGDFSSEIYKIELTNLPKKFGISQLKKRLIFLGLNPCKIKSVDSSHYAFITFRTEKHREKALQVLEGNNWKGKTLHCRKAAANADPLQMKRKLEADGSEEHKTKMLKNEDNVSKLSSSEQLNNAVTPLWKTEYAEQLKIKEKNISQFIKKVGKQIEKNCPSDRQWLNSQRKVNWGLCCKQYPIKPSPIVNGYRNKCEFTIGASPDGKESVVGFRLGSYRAGVLSVLEPTDCINIPDSMKRVCKDLQAFLRTRSACRSAFCPSDRTGHWQMATVRTVEGGGVMLSVVIHPQTLTQEELNVEKDMLREYFDSLPAECRIASLYFVVESDRRDANTEAECEYLSGAKYIEENLLGMTFRVSPSAFFQVNTPAAEVLYQTIGDWCRVTPQSTLLDVCCGTGTIGLTLAKRVKKVIGVELCSRAIEDAKANALNNGVSNVEFLCGKAEDILPTLMLRFSSLDQVDVVVDPPRAGLHADVVRAIRKCACVRRFVYVSCKPSAATQNIIDFTRLKSKRFVGAPFRLVATVPVDMFPHTEHCELVLLFERDCGEGTDGKLNDCGKGTGGNLNDCGEETGET